MKKRSSKSHPESPTAEDRTYEAIVAEAQALPLSGVLDFKADAKLVVANARVGAEALQGAEALLAAQLRRWDGSLARHYAAVADAFERACREVARVKSRGPNRTLAQALAEAWPLRRKLLLLARLLADEGLVRAATVKLISRGGGAVDAADDLEDLARLFTGAWRQIDGKVPITRAQLERASTLAATLRQEAGLSRQRRLVPPELRRAREVRVRLFTLLRLARDAAWPYAALAFGEDEVEQKFPPLGTWRRTKSSKRAGKGKAVGGAPVAAPR